MGWVGPSPRARGAHRCDRRTLAGSGTIPAGAGSTGRRAGHGCRCRDHPRGRGEHVPSGVGVRGIRGPSPRARGALQAAEGPPGDPGTIPAGAGSTRWPCRSWSSSRDHPRGRGEHAHLRRKAGEDLGPSPRARGALDPALSDGPQLGTIPAGAGGTSATLKAAALSWDHPRGRGEHCLSCSFSSSILGPSPRARGARIWAMRWGSMSGTIPAGAGSTTRRRRAGTRTRDHPRGRGEHSRQSGFGFCGTGPSPRARGAPHPASRRSGVAGTIPAGAGSTGRCRP